MNPDQMPEPPYVAAFNATESNSFGYYLELMARGDGWNVDQVVNFQVFMLSTFFTTTVQYNTCITAMFSSRVPYQ